MLCDGWFTLWDAVPGELFEFFEIYDVGLEDELKVLAALLGGIIL